MAKVIENVTFTNQERAIVEAGHDLLTIKNVNINMVELNATSTSATLGCDLRKNKLVDIDTLNIKAVDLKRKYAYGLRLGYSGDATSGNELVRMKNSYIDGFGPSNQGDYNKSNRDGVALEFGELWLKNTVIASVSDACIDAKGPVKAQNCVFKNGYRDIRIWPGQTVILSNCQVGTVWFKDNTGTLILYNTMMPSVETDSGSASVPKVISENPLNQEWFTGIKRLNLTAEQLEWLKAL